MDTAQLTIPQLLTYPLLQTLRPNRKHPHRLVDKKILLKIGQHPQHLGRLGRCPLYPRLHHISRLHRMPRHPDALPVDKDPALIDQLFGRPSRNLETLSQNIL